METSEIKVVFFDIGGLLLSNGWGHESRQEAAKKSGSIMLKWMYCRFHF